MITKCLLLEQNNTTYERITLHRLLQDCKNMVNGEHVMYIHSKGVTHPPHSQYYDRVRMWTTLMLEGLTTYRYLCWRYLERGADAV
jgi:hypothetical protein